MVQLSEFDEQRLYSCSVALRFGESVQRVEGALTDLKMGIMLDFHGEVFMQRPSIIEGLLYTLTVRI